MDIVLTLVIVIFFSMLWWVYYLYVNTITVPQLSPSDLPIKTTPTMTNNIYSIIFGLALLWLFLLNYILVQHISTVLAFWDALYLSNNTLVFFFFSLMIMLIINIAVSVLNKQNISFNVEYISFIYIIVFSGYLLISSTNLFISIFFLEFIALLIFGKFTVSKIIYKNSKTTTNTPNYITQYSYGLFNALFFQFWANFVSSIFLFFSLINIHYMCGTSNFFFVNFIFTAIKDSWFYSEYLIAINFSVFITGLFIKLGLSPYQFFKIETYKGIPMFMVILYTTIYLLVYIYFFIYLFYYQLPIIRLFTGSYILAFITFSLLYLISLLFDTKNFKAFLSYSTLITVMNILVIILTI